ncbi:MAG: family 43 glycosylhydrolase [Bacteroidales bacterium]|nr:family 43 glycosylhydrolase [Bacteroidales bacterium]
MIKKLAFIVAVFVLSFVYGFSQFAGPTYPDTYPSLINVSQRINWGPYNVHDPSVIKEGEWFYMFSTDAMVAYDPPAIVGIQVRKSMDLINWQFVGFAFDGIPQEANDHLAANGKTASSIWAPYITKYQDTFRLYYCVSAYGTRISYLGMAVSDSLEGPWTQKGCIVKTTDADAMNAIDPTVVTGKDGKQYLGYGSWFGGLYMKNLVDSTGMAESVSDKGWLIARRSGSGLEAAEIVYNPVEDKYYLFVSYDPLLNNYNVRVGRSDNPAGPFYDMAGNDMALTTDNLPMILNPYKFMDHRGWQGTGHCSVIQDNDQFYIINQGRPVADIYMMVCHVRKMNWIDGWPVVSPERYGGNPAEYAPPLDSVMTRWEHMVLGYSLSFGLDVSTLIDLRPDGTISNDAASTWSYADGQLSLRWNNGQYNDTCKVWYEWDWENKRVCMVYSGISNNHVCIWGKSSVKPMPSGMDDHYANGDVMRIELYPNPAKEGFVWLEIPDLPEKKLGIRILDMNGRIIRSYRIEQPGKMPLNTCGLKGLHFIQVISKKAVITKKIIVN